MQKVTRKKIKYRLWMAIIWCSLWWLSPVWAEKNGEVKNTANMASTPDENISDQEENPLIRIPFIQKVSLSSEIELNYEYIDPSDAGDNNSEVTSDLYLGSMDLALRIIFDAFGKAKVVVSAEDLGKNDTNAEVILDEATFTLDRPWKPFYFTAGKTTLPFGVFEDRLIGGTLTDDLYDIEDIGATLGYTQDSFSMDISATIYKGQNVIENLVDFGTHEFNPSREPNDEVDSFITNLTFEPIEERLMLAVFYNSEPGDANRNRSLGGAISYHIWRVIFDAEYIAAVERERGDDGVQNKENAWLTGLAFQPIDALELATRYDVFNDDRIGLQDEILDYRYSVGFNYTFFQLATFSFEYRHSEFEKERDSIAAEDQDAFMFQLSLAFE